MILNKSQMALDNTIERLKTQKQSNVMLVEITK